MIGVVQTRGVRTHATIEVRRPFAGRALLDFLAYHLVPGVEVAGEGWYARTLDLAGGPATVRVDLADDTAVRATYDLADVGDLADAVRRTRWLVDPEGAAPRTAAHLARDPLLAPLVGARPGLRVPGQVDGDETAVRTVVGQQVSVTGARTVTGRVVRAHGREVATAVPGLTHLFPAAATLAEVDPETLPMPRARARALVGLCAALASGEVVLDRDRAATLDAGEVDARMLALRGIGPWTVGYVAIRALGDPDRFLPTDLGVRQAITRLGADPVEVLARSDTWSPWRSAALMHLWATLMPPGPTTPTLPTLLP